jgi:hypothetical protein
MIKFFKNNNPAIFVLFPIIIFLFNLKVFYSETIYKFPEFPTVFTQKIFNLIEGANSLLAASFINGILLIVVTFLFMNLLSKYIYFEARNYFHGFIFIFLNTIFISPYEYIPVIIAELFFVIALIILFGAAKKQNAVFDFFNISFILALGSLFWFNLIYFTIIIFFSLIIMRRILIREWISLIVGTVTPYLLLVSIYFILYGNIEILDSIKIMFSKNTSELSFTNIYLIYFGFLFLLGILSGLKILSVFNGLNIDLREYYKIFNWINLLALIILFFSDYQNTGALYFSLLTLTIPITRFFNFTKRKLFFEITFDILLVLLILTQIWIKIPYFE